MNDLMPADRKRRRRRRWVRAITRLEYLEVGFRNLAARGVGKLALSVVKFGAKRR